MERQRHAIVANAIVRLPADFSVQHHRQPGVDVRLEKGFRLAQPSSASLLVDVFNVFNVFNSDNFGCYDTEIRSANNPNTNLGTPNCSGLGRPSAGWAPLRTEAIE